MDLETFYNKIFIPLLSSGAIITSIIILVKVRSEEKRFKEEIDLKIEELFSVENRWEREHYKKIESDAILEYLALLT